MKTIRGTIMPHIHDAHYKCDNCDKRGEGKFVRGVELGADEKSFLCLPEDWLRHSDGTTFCSELCEARFYLCRFEEKVKMLEAKYHIAVEAEIENE